MDICLRPIQELEQSKWRLTEEEKLLLLPPLPVYDNPVVMPLAEFARHPIAADLLHNGQTFQVIVPFEFQRFKINL